MSAKLTTRFAYTATKDAATISLRAIEGTQTSKSVRPAEFYSADTWLNEQRGESPWAHRPQARVPLAQVKTTASSDARTVSANCCGSNGFDRKGRSLDGVPMVVISGK